MDGAAKTVEKLEVELKELQATLANIERARPFEDLTVGLRDGYEATRRLHERGAEVLVAQVLDVGHAHPQIFKSIDKTLEKGKWTVPGTLAYNGPRCFSFRSICPCRLQGEVWRPVAHVEIM